MWRPPKNAPNSEKCTKFDLRISEGYHQSRGLINYIETKAKCPHPKKITYKGTLFVRVYRPEIQSVMLVFSYLLCEVLSF